MADQIVIHQEHLVDQVVEEEHLELEDVELLVKEMTVEIHPQLDMEVLVAVEQTQQGEMEILNQVELVEQVPQIQLQDQQ